MASNPYVNRVDYVAGGVTHTLIDITSDTVTPSTLLQGYTAHDASGAAISGAVANGDSLAYGVTTQPIVGTARVGATTI